MAIRTTTCTWSLVRTDVGEGERTEYYEIMGYPYISVLYNDYPEEFGYVTKHDAHYITSENHPPLMSPQKTRNASVAATKRTWEMARGNDDNQYDKNEK